MQKLNKLLAISTKLDLGNTNYRDTTSKIRDSDINKIFNFSVGDIKELILCTYDRSKFSTISHMLAFLS